MKKIITLNVFAVILFYVAVSCSSVTESDENNADPVIGTWELTSIVDEAGSTPFFFFPIESMTRTFKADNTVTQLTVADYFNVKSKDAMTGTWSVKNGMYTMVDTKHPTADSTFTVSGSKLTEPVTGSGVTYTYIYTRQE